MLFVVFDYISKFEDVDLKSSVDLVNFLRDVV